MERKDLDLILNNLDSSLGSRFFVEKVRNLVWENVRQVGTDFIVPEDCYDLSITDVLRLYKIELLIENNIVSEDEGIKLRELFLEYTNVQKKIGAEAYKQLMDDSYKSIRLSKLHGNLKDITEVLNQFYIMESDTNYAEILKTYYLSKFERQQAQKTSEYYAKLASQEDRDIDRAVASLTKHLEKNKGI